MYIEISISFGSPYRLRLIIKLISIGRLRDCRWLPLVGLKWKKEHLINVNLNIHIEKQFILILISFKYYHYFSFARYVYLLYSFLQISQVCYRVSACTLSHHGPWSHYSNKQSPTTENYFYGWLLEVVSHTANEAPAGQFLRNLFLTHFRKVISAQSSIKYIQTFWYQMIDETFIHPYLWKFFKKC